MDPFYFLQVVFAVMVANAASGVFFFGLMAAHRLEKKGIKQHELPLWVYLCLLCPLVVAASGAWFMNALL